MHIRAHVSNSPNVHTSEVVTDGRRQQLAVPAKRAGGGSSVNGGELLFLALATCYCNDLYREAESRGIRLSCVEVEVAGEFRGRGEPAAEVTYRARVEGDASAAVLAGLLEDTDAVAEIQNTLRRGCAVRFVGQLE